MNLSKFNVLMPKFPMLSQKYSRLKTKIPEKTPLIIQFIKSNDGLSKDSKISLQYMRSYRFNKKNSYNYSTKLNLIIKKKNFAKLNRQVKINY